MINKKIFEEIDQDYFAKLSGWDEEEQSAERSNDLK